MGERARQRGLTFVELMIGLAVLAVILTLAAPSFFEYLLTQRLKGTQAQLVTDLQFARSEAVARNLVLRVHFRSNDAMSCYTLYTSPFNSQRCNCTLGVGAACTIAGTTELRTVQIPRNLRVVLEPAVGQPSAFGYDPVTGGIISIPLDNPSQPLERVVVAASVDTARTIHTIVNRAGRPTACAPAGSKMPLSSC